MARCSAASAWQEPEGGLLAVQQNPVDLKSPDITLRLIVSNCHESHGMPDTVRLTSNVQKLMQRAATAPNNLICLLLPSTPNHA